MNCSSAHTCKCNLGHLSFPTNLRIANDGDANRQFPLLAAAQMFHPQIGRFVQINVLQRFLHLAFDQMLWNALRHKQKYTPIWRNNYTHASLTRTAAKKTKCSFAVSCSKSMSCCGHTPVIRRITVISFGSLREYRMSKLGGEKILKKMCARAYYRMS